MKDVSAIFGVHHFVIYNWEEGEIPPQILPIVERWIVDAAPLTEEERAACLEAAHVGAACFLGMRSCLLLVRSIVTSTLHPPEDAEEVIQEVMLKLTHTGWDHAFPERLVRDITRKALSSFRSRRRRTARFSPDASAVLEELADASTGEPSMTTRLQISRSWHLLERWFDDLAPGQKQIVELVFEDYAVTEISESIGVPDGVVSQRLYRARAHLRKKKAFAPLREALALSRQPLTEKTSNTDPTAFRVGMQTNGGEIDEGAEDEATLEIAVLELEEAANDTLDRGPIGGRRDEAGLGPLVLPRLYEVLEEDGAVAERVQ